MEFKDKIKTLQFAPTKSGQGNRVREGFSAEGYRLKETREGDPDVGYVTHTEHAKGDRVDATVQPKTLNLKTTTKG